MQPLQPSELEILIEDFGDISRRVSEELRRQQEVEKVRGTKRDPKEERVPALNLQEFRFLEKGLVWYNGKEGVNMTPIGQPRDYLQIRDDFGKLKKFLAETLDKGRVEYGCDGSVTNTGEYFTWMYFCSQHQPFRQNTEQAVVELLRDELGRKFTPLANTARQVDAQKSAPQFNRLVGLLDVVSIVGKPDNGFAEAYADLAQKAREGFMRDAPTLRYGYDRANGQANIYNNILSALARIQKNDELRDLWLRNIKEGQFGRVFESVYGLLGAYKTKRRKREQIPAVLAKLQEKGWHLDPAKIDTYPPINIDDENLLKEIVGHAVSLTYWSGEVSPWDKLARRFNHLDKRASSLDILIRRSVEDGEYHFTFTRYTPKGRQGLKATYDLRTDKTFGDAQLENTIRVYFDDGYEIGDKIKVTSLEGRRIMGNKTTIVEADNQKVNGLYEGLVGLNYALIPFLYDAASGMVLLAEPPDSMGEGSYSGGWTGRRIGLGNVTAKIPYAEFKPVSQFAQRVEELYQKTNPVGYPRFLLWPLNERLSDKTASPLSLVISSRLVKAEDGLVQ